MLYSPPLSCSNSVITRVPSVEIGWVLSTHLNMITHMIRKLTNNEQNEHSNNHNYITILLEC